MGNGDWKSDNQGRAGSADMTAQRRGRSHAHRMQALKLSNYSNPAKIAAGAVFLILIIAAIALVAHLIGTPQKPAQEQAATQPQAPYPSAQHYSKPNPGTPMQAPGSAPKAPATANAAKPSTLEPSIAEPGSASPPAGTVAGTVAGAVAPNSAPRNPPPNATTSQLAPYRVTATHKEFGGGCEGKLALSNNGLHFSCPGEPDINVPLAQIDRVDKDGIRLLSGKKYHFKIADDHTAVVESIFDNWLEKARQNHAAYGSSASNVPTN